MRLLEYIQGELFPTTLMDKTRYLNLDNRILEKIEKQCGQIIKIYKKSGCFLYRGLRLTDRVKKIGNNIYIIVPRKDRWPKDTNEHLHEMMDNYFLRRFGWRARSRGVFCSGSMNVAKEYGNTTGIIFPADGFKYLWSRRIKDLYSDQLESIDDRISGLWYEEYGNIFTNGYWENDLNGEKKFWKNRDDIRNEIGNIDRIETYEYSDPHMIVIFLKNNTKIPYNWIPKIEYDDYKYDVLEGKCDLITSMYTDKNIVTAIETGNEIMINCEYYYFIETRGSLIPKDLNIDEI